MIWLTFVVNEKIYLTIYIIYRISVMLTDSVFYFILPSCLLPPLLQYNVCL